MCVRGDVLGGDVAFPFVLCGEEGAAAVGTEEAGEVIGIRGSWCRLLRRFWGAGTASC